MRGCNKLTGDDIYKYHPRVLYLKRKKFTVKYSNSIISTYVVASCQLPVASCQLPVVSCQLPVASCQLPVIWVMSVRGVSQVGER